MSQGKKKKKHRKAVPGFWLVLYVRSVVKPSLLIKDSVSLLFKKETDPHPQSVLVSLEGTISGCGSSSRGSVILQKKQQQAQLRFSWPLRVLHIGRARSSETSPLKSPESWDKPLFVPQWGKFTIHKSCNVKETAYWYYHLSVVSMRSWAETLLVKT